MIADQYQPEIGQMLFGQPTKSFAVPDIMDAALEHLDHELGRVMWNLRQREFESPFRNNGASFRCSAFTVVAYSWSDDPQPYNFKHPQTGVEISWYKYLGRGMSSNVEITPDLAARVLDDCLKACKAIEKGEMRFDEPGPYPDGVAS